MKQLASGRCRAGRKGGERLRLCVADRHQGGSLEDEGNGRLYRFVGGKIEDCGGGHEFRAGLMIKPRRELDLLHFALRRDGDAKPLLHGAIVIDRRIEQVEPDGRPAVIAGRSQLPIAAHKHTQHMAYLRGGSPTDREVSLTGS